MSDDIIDADVVDMVNHPPHYQNHPIFSGECIDYTSLMMFGQGNAFKYLWRAGRKEDEAEDVSKSVFYTTNPRCNQQIPLPKNILLKMRQDLLTYTKKNPDDIVTIQRGLMMISIAAGVL